MKSSITAPYLSTEKIGKWWVIVLNVEGRQAQITKFTDRRVAERKMQEYADQIANLEPEDVEQREED